MKEKKKLEKKNFFKIGIDLDKYKIPERELHDTLLLERSRDEVAKIFTTEEEKANGNFRFCIGGKCLRKVLMFRGESLSVNKVEMM